MEFCDGQDLYRKVNENKKRGAFFSEADIWSAFIQLLQGLAQLHSSNVLHRDLKVAVSHKERKCFPDLTRRGEAR